MKKLFAILALATVMGSAVPAFAATRRNDDGGGLAARIISAIRRVVHTLEDTANFPKP